MKNRFYILAIILLAGLLCFGYVVAQTSTPEKQPNAPASPEAQADKNKEQVFKIDFKGSVGARKDPFVKPGLTSIVNVPADSISVPDETGQVQAAPVDYSGDIHLTGVMWFNGTRIALAIVDGKTVRLKPGDVVSGIRVVSVGFDSITCQDKEGKGKPFKSKLGAPAESSATLEKKDGKTAPDADNLVPPPMQKPQEAKKDNSGDKASVKGKDASGTPTVKDTVPNEQSKKGGSK